MFVRRNGELSLKRNHLPTTITKAHSRWCLLFSFERVKQLANDSLWILGSLGTQEQSNKTGMFLPSWSNKDHDETCQNFQSFCFILSCSTCSPRHVPFILPRSPSQSLAPEHHGAGGTRRIRVWLGSGCTLFNRPNLSSIAKDSVFFISHLASWLRTRRFSEVTFRPSRPTNHWKNTMTRDFPTFSHNRGGSLPKGLQGSPEHTKGDGKMVFEIFLRCGTQAPGANCPWFRMMPGVNAGFLVPLGALAAPIHDRIGPVARLRVFRGRLSIPKVIARWLSKSGR